MEFIFQNQTLQLLPQKCIFWKEQSALIMSDLHLGKVMHFRKNGIQAPSQLIEKELSNFTGLLTSMNPQTLIIVGDLFHSDINSEWEGWLQMLSSFPALSVLLIRGNHDRMPAYILKQANIKTVSKAFISPFVFSHQPIESEHYVISGHVHPGISLKGLAKQRVSVPCFYFGKTFALLPAFGNFTGKEIITPQRGDLIFAIAGTEIIEIET